MPFDECGDWVCSLCQSFFRLVREDESHVMVTEVVRAPGVHRRDGDVFLLEKLATEFPRRDAKRPDVGDEKVATVWGDNLQPRNPGEAGDQDIASALIRGRRLGQVVLRSG